MTTKIFLENKDTRKLCEVLNLAEIRSGRFNTDFSNATISNFKTGIEKRITENMFLSFKTQLNEFSIILKSFATKPVQANEKYFEELLDLADTPFFNFKEVYRNTQISVPYSPNYSVLLWSYYSSGHKFKQEPNGNLIEKYMPFFEQLKYELLLLSKKIKI